MLFIVQIYFVDVNKRDWSKNDRPIFLHRHHVPCISELSTFIKLLLSKENGKEIDCRKNATTFRTLSDKRFRSALARHVSCMCYCEIRDWQWRPRSCHASKFTTKGTFWNAFTTYLTFQQSSNTWDKNRKMLGIFFSVNDRNCR